jgi:hypothetical protein
LGYWKQVQNRGRISTTLQEVSLMSAATITALCSGLAGVIAAVTGLVIAFKANNKAKAAATTATANAKTINDHIKTHP